MRRKFFSDLFLTGLILTAVSELTAEIYPYRENNDLSEEDDQWGSITLSSDISDPCTCWPGTEGDCKIGGDEFEE